ncbi:MAG: hypothetical protein WCL54_02575 [Clostridia bacterium]
MLTQKFKRQLAKVILLAFLCSMLLSPIPVTQASAATTLSYYDYMQTMSDNDQAVALGMFFASVGLWTGDLETEDGIQRFSSYLIYDMDAVKNEGSSIWSKLSANGMDASVMARLVKENLSFRPSLREFFAIANTLDETAIRALDKNKKLLLYPLEQKFVGRNVALSFVLFKFFNTPVLRYKSKFTTVTKNVEFLENAKSLYTIPDAANVSYVDAAKNFAIEMNRLTKVQIQINMPILQHFNIVENTSSPSISPTVTPTSGSPTPKPTAMPTPKLEQITKKIEGICKKKGLAKTDIVELIHQTDALRFEIKKWYARSDRYAIESLKDVARVTTAFTTAIQKIKSYNDRKLLVRLTWLFDCLKLLPEKALSVTSLNSRMDQLILSSSRLLQIYHPITVQDRNSLTGLKKKLAEIVTLLVRYASKVMLPARLIQGNYQVLIDQKKNVQISAAIAVSSQSAKHFRNYFLKVKMNVSKYFNPERKWCLVVISGMKTPAKQVIRVSGSTSAVMQKKIGTRFMLLNPYYAIDVPVTSLHPRYLSEIVTKTTNSKTLFTFSYFTHNMKKSQGLLIAKYKLIGDGKKPKSGKIVFAKSTIKAKIVFEEILDQVKVVF